MRWLGWLHRRCERERAADQAQFAEWTRQSKASWVAKNKEVSETANRRISEAAAKARAKVAEAHNTVAELVRQRTDHAMRTAAMRSTAERAREREDAYAQGFADGRAEVLQDGPPVPESLVRLLTAAPRNGSCDKVRLNDREHAELMVAHVLETTRVRTEPYQCPTCPRQLFGRGKWWHVRTVDNPTERAKRDRLRAGQGPRSPERLALRLPPEQIQLLNERARGSVDNSGVEQFGSSLGS